MSAKKRITRRTIVGMKITAAEWKVILDNVMGLDDNYAQIISDRPDEDVPPARTDVPTYP